MKTSRRSFFSLAAGAAVLASAERVRPAQALPAPAVEHDLGGPHAWGERYNGTGYLSDPGHTHTYLTDPTHSHSYSFATMAKGGVQFYGPVI